MQFPSTYVWLSSSYDRAILQREYVTSLASLTADKGCFIYSYKESKLELLSKILYYSTTTYKFMHLVESDDQLFIGNFVDNSICTASFTSFATMMSITLVQTYDISWAENSQFLLHIIVFSLFSFFLLGDTPFFGASGQMEQDSTVNSCSNVLDEKFCDGQITFFKFLLHKKIKEC